MENKNITCNELSREIRKYTRLYPKNVGLPIKVRKYNEKRIEIICYGNREKREFALKALFEHFPVEERDSNTYYVENINVSIL